MPQLAKGRESSGANPDIDRDIVPPTSLPQPKSYADLNQPADMKQGAQYARDSVRRSSGAMGADEEATEEEQAEYERAVGALTRVLYEDDNTAQAIQDQLRPEEKVGSVAKASILVVSNLDQKLDLDEIIIPQFTQEVTDRIIDLYENLHGEEFSEKEAQHAAGATWEGVMEIFGIDEEDYEELIQGMSDEDLKGVEQQYNQFLE